MNLFQSFARMKNYFSQGNIYMAIANFFITMFTWLAVLQVSTLWYVSIPFLGLCGIIFVGWLDFYLVKKHEVAHANTMNDLKTQLDHIQKLLEERT